MPGGRAQPQPRQHAGVDLRGHVDHGLPGARRLQVERQLVAGAAVLVQLGQGGHVRRQLRPGELADRSLAKPGGDDAVVVEHRLAVGGQPDVALETGRTEPQAEGERLERVLPGVCPGTPMGEGDG